VVSLRAVVGACRPRQWTKNALLLAAPAAAGVITHATVLGHAAVAIVAFCMLSSATYLLNDVRDRAHDRHHARKRHRPIASGELSPRAALTIAAGLAATGLALAAAVRIELAAVGCGYLLLTASYSLLWRRVVVVDILAIAAGFLLRAAAGGAATDVALSRWFLVVTSCCAVFVVAGKRHAELFGDASGQLARATLRRYSASALHATLALAAAAAISAYAMWAFGRPEHGPWYEITIVPVVLWLSRYTWLIGRGGGEAPEELILRDRALLLLTLAWTALFLAGIYVGH
jgi:decaprenyl-phosphate phosphoribosyltransferase